jgi:hypothetical protein
VHLAAQYFAAANKIGEGGFGAVYRGVLDGIPVAVKVMDGGPNAMQVTGVHHLVTVWSHQDSSLILIQYQMSLHTLTCFRSSACRVNLSLSMLRFRPEGVQHQLKPWCIRMHNQDTSHLVSAGPKQHPRNLYP